MKKPFKNIIAVLGADRVGKSTTCEFLKGNLQNVSHSSEILHFSGPQTYHNSPIDQYTEEINKHTILESPMSLILDRFGSEVCFYEQFRRHFTISEEWANAAESYASSLCENLLVVFLKAEWSTVKPRHEQEIATAYPNATLYYRNLLMAAREKEHEAYQEYMTNFLISTRRKTLISLDNIFVINTESLGSHKRFINMMAQYDFAGKHQLENKIIW